MILPFHWANILCFQLPSEVLIIRDAAKWGHACLYSGLGLCMLELFLGSSHTCLLCKVECPALIKTCLCKIWMRMEKGYAVIATLLSCLGVFDKLCHILHMHLVVLSIIALQASTRWQCLCLHLVLTVHGLNVDLIEAQQCLLKFAINILVFTAHGSSEAH